MSFNNGYDVRSVANVIVRLAQKNNKSVSNLSINKIVYFLHVAYLHEFERPLVSAKIEAWDHGPVFRELYHQFKRFGKNEITELARRMDPVSGHYVVCMDQIPPEEESFLLDQGAALLDIPTSKLVAMSHVSDGAWFQARYGSGRVNPGAEITDEMICESGTNARKH